MGFFDFLLPPKPVNTDLSSLERLIGELREQIEAMQAEGAIEREDAATLRTKLKEMQDYVASTNVSLAKVQNDIKAIQDEIIRFEEFIVLQFESDE